MDGTAEQRALQELVLLQHAARATAFRGMLEPAEVVHNTAPVLFLQVARSYSPAAGEGVLLVTSGGLVWGPEQADWPTVRFDQLTVERVLRGGRPSAFAKPETGLGFAGFRWPKSEIRKIEERPCPRFWHRRPMGIRRRERRQMRRLHMEVGDTDVDLVGGWLFTTDVVRYLRGEPPAVEVSGRRVVWGDDGETGAMIAVIKQAADSKPMYTATPYPMRHFEADDPELESTNMLATQALGELSVSLGLDPMAGYEWPRPAWMPEFRWDPPLPSRPYR